MPLIPLPVVGEPFDLTAMDIVGPLPRSRARHRYILVICDYATRYPEAVLMKSIDAEQVAEELVKFFSRVGIPREILTDQGINFTSISSCTYTLYVPHTTTRRRTASSRGSTRR